MKLQLSGNQMYGKIIGDGQSYDYRLEDGFARVRLPFAVDQERLRHLLTVNGWAVAWGHENLDTLGWGEGYDLEGYYPYWICPEPGRNGSPTIFSYLRAFPWNTA